MISLPYGTLPTREAFDAHCARIVGAVDDDGEGATYALDLKGADAHAAEDAGFSAHEKLSRSQLWRLVENLAQDYNESLDRCITDEEIEIYDAAGDLASSILYSLEFEWI